MKPGSCVVRRDELRVITTEHQLKLLLKSKGMPIDGITSLELSPLFVYSVERLCSGSLRYRWKPL